MQRCTTYRASEALGAVQSLLTPRLDALWHSTDLFVGADPVFAGLHTYSDIVDGRSYTDTSHVVYPYHQLHLHRSWRNTTMVLRAAVSPFVVAHEFGHVVHQLSGWALTTPTSRYGRTNFYEAFAENFTAWLFGWRECVWDEDWALMEAIAGSE